MHYPTKHFTGQLNKHVVVFSVRVRRWVGSGVAPRRVGLRGTASMPEAASGSGAIKHNEHCYDQWPEVARTKLEWWNKVLKFIFFAMTTIDEIQKLERRKDMAVFQRKITTQLCTFIEYDQEIGAIDRRLEQLRYRLKKEERGEKLNFKTDLTEWTIPRRTKLRPLVIAVVMQAKGWPVCWGGSWPEGWRQATRALALRGSGWAWPACGSANCA